MTHTHSHDDDHDHNHADSPELSFEEKLATLFRHWIDHNNSHKENYFSWARKAGARDLESIVPFLEEAGALSEKITLTLEAALKKLNQ